ncbi:MAG: beta-ketoacyl-ACP synthase II [Paludibacteraceae bacterium]|nr:beta-ketoacyl-ACP synthase II [Paludibacteraceae bacterium]MBP5481948.1 beta-ketoacyl-ACP synthase II [Paludibacteraceae bacterium]
MSMRRVVITGMGIISPIGKDIKTFWENLKNGVCGIDFIQNIDTTGLDVKIAGEVRDFRAEDFGVEKGMARKADRYCQFALAAAQQAMNDRGDLGLPNERVGVYVGSGIGGMQTFLNESKKMLEEGPGRISPLFIPMMISNIAAGNIAIAHHAEGPCLPVVTACATSTHAIGEAYRAIKYGYADAIIAGGAEATINPLAIGGFTNCKALSKSSDPKRASLPFDAERKGFVIGEGAGIVILEEYEHAKATGAKIYGEICGYGNTCDAYHYTAPKPDGTCASRAIKMALDEANYSEKDTLYVNAHGTGTHMNDSSETQALKLALGDKEARRAHISSSKSMTGHMLGAAGGVEVIVSALSLQEGIVTPTIGLNNPDPECDLNYTPNKAQKADLTIAISNSLGFGGHNACVAIRK